TTTTAFGACECMPLYVVSSLPGSVDWAKFSADCTAATQSLVPSSAQVSMMLEKPTSLPPMVMLTNVVVELSADSWLELTVSVVAPAQATDAYDAGACAVAQSAEYAFVLRSHEPLELIRLPAPRPDAYESPSAT